MIIFPFRHEGDDKIVKKDVENINPAKGINTPSENKPLSVKEVPQSDQPITQPKTIGDLYNSAYDKELSDAEYQMLSNHNNYYDIQKRNDDVINQFQREIDALEIEKNNARARIQEFYSGLNKERQGSASAISARRGLSGSTFADAYSGNIKQEIDQQMLNSISDVDSQYNQRMSSLYENMRNTQQKQTEDTYNNQMLNWQAKIENLKTNKERRNNAINEIIKNALTYDIDILQEKDLLDQLKSEYNISDAEINNLINKHQQEAYQQSQQQLMEKLKTMKAMQTVLREGEVLVDADGRVVAMGNGGTVTLKEGEKVVDKNTGRIIAESDKYYTLGEGQVVADSYGNIISSGKDKNVILNQGEILFNAQGTPIAYGPDKTTQQSILIDKQQIEKDEEYNQEAKKANNILTLTNELKGMDWRGIVGSVQGRLPVFSGKKVATLNKLKELTAGLTMLNMDMIKGVLSDSDMKILKEGSAPLQRSTDEETFEREMNKLINNSMSILNYGRLDINEIIANDNGTYSYKNNDGTVHTGEFGDGYVDKTVLQPKIGIRAQIAQPTADAVESLWDDDFNNVVGDTDTARNETVAKLKSIPQGDKGGQCGRFVNRLTGLGVGDSYASKMAKMDKAIKQPQAGMVFVMPYKDTGHIGFIVDVKDGMAEVIDSNWKKDERVARHFIPVSKMTGFRKIT